MRRLIVTLLLLVSAAAVPAFAKTTAKPAAATASKNRVSDAEIQSTLRAKLAKSKIGKDGFQFKVAAGIVTWQGRTDVMQHKGSATRMAKSAGATAVVNNIQISEKGRSKMATNFQPRKAVVKP